MKRIVVTGAAGRLGRKVVAELLSRDYEVLATDLERPESIPCRFLQADLTDAAAVLDVLTGADAVIHLGAIPGPLSQPRSVTFRNNVLSTWNVAETAAAVGLKRIVSASSVFTLGWHESPETYWPESVPVDESHPVTPYEAYGLSKVVGEEIIATVSRRCGIPAVSLRLMNIIQEDGYFALPWPVPTRGQPVRFVLWPYVDVRDAATSCRLALEAPVSGHEAVFIAAEETRFDAETAALLREFAPEVKLDAPIRGSGSVISIEKARHLLGFQPKFSWRQFRASIHS
ncbi:NAD-dependent epimerase/dehydratase family protein [bacterium]|nr:NAD-dependent epimerase/dehydratase family protein [bacterium]